MTLSKDELAALREKGSDASQTLKLFPLKADEQSSDVARFWLKQYVTDALAMLDHIEELERENKTAYDRGFDDHKKHVGIWGEADDA